jgi:hypothetical protein
MGCLASFGILAQERIRQQGGSSVFSCGSSIKWNKIVDVVFCGKWTRFSNGSWP